jgi:hypothetical protein
VAALIICRDHFVAPNKYPRYPLSLPDFTDPPDHFPESIHAFKGDITRSSGWSAVLDHIAVHGKFDLVVCTHTLEDLLDPQMVVESLPLVAKAGRIAVPSRFTEMSRSVSSHASETLGFNDENGLAGNFRGFYHHFWVFTVIGGIVTGVPKSPLLEEDFYEKNGMVYDGVETTDGTDIRESFGEINLWWEGELESWEELPLKIFNTGFKDMLEYVGMPKTGFYSDHIAGLHAYRELFQGDDLNTLSGLFETFEIVVDSGEGPEIKKVGVNDDGDGGVSIGLFVR